LNEYYHPTASDAFCAIPPSPLLVPRDAAASRRSSFLDQTVSVLARRSGGVRDQTFRVGACGVLRGFPVLVGLRRKREGRLARPIYSGTEISEQDSRAI